MRVAHSIKLDVKKTNIQKIIHATQGEGADRELIFTLVSGNEPLHLSASNTVSIIGHKPDDTVFDNAATIKNGKVYYNLTTNNLAAVGDVDCQLQVVSDGVTYSAKFVIDVEEPVVDDEEIESSNEFSQLVALIQKVQKQVTVWQGEGEPDTNPDTYDEIKESDFYYDETNKRYYFLNTLSVVLSWSRLYTYEESESKADKSNTYTKSEVYNKTETYNKSEVYNKTETYNKSEVDEKTGEKSKVWDGFDDPFTGTALGKLTIGEDYEGIKVGDFYYYKPSISYNFPQITFGGMFEVVRVGTTYAYLKKTDKTYYGASNIPPAYGANDIVIVNVDPEEIFEVGTVWYRNHISGSNLFEMYILDNIYFSFNVGRLTIEYSWTKFSNIVTSESLLNNFAYNETFRSRLADDEESSEPLALKEYVDRELSGKQNTIDNTHKLDSDNVDDSESTNKFVSATEKSAIGKEPKYELIKTIDISQLSEPVSMIIIDEDEEGNAFAYDDIAIKIEGLIGSAQGKLQIQTMINNSVFANYFQSNVLQTTARNRYVNISREAPGMAVFTLGGYTNTTGIYSNDFEYTDKIDEVRIITDTTFIGGVATIYGKVKY